MADKRLAQRYVNNFRRKLTRHLRPGVGLRVTVYPAQAQGGVIEVQLGELENDDEYRPPVPTVNEALKSIPQRAFGGNLDGFRFEGTNIVMEPSRILLIKGTDRQHEWSENAAEKDVRRILRGGKP